MDITTGWRKLSINAKRITVIALSCLLLYSIYMFNIKKTVKKIREYYALSNLVSQQPDNPSTKSLNYAHNYQYINNYTSSELITNIAKYAKEQNIEIKKISQVDETITDHNVFETVEIIVSSEYTEILELMFQIEYIFNFKSLNSISIELIHEKETNNHTLQARLYVKTVKYEKVS